jgi:hypothetical protein
MQIPEVFDGLDFDYSALSFAVIWPSYASGRSSIFNIGKFCREVYAPSPDYFFPLFPAAMSADWQYWIMRADTARQNKAVPPRPTSYVTTKMDESQALIASQDERTHAMLDMIRDQLQSRRSLLVGGLHAVYKFAAAGVARGMTPGFSPGSAVAPVGGLKGFPAAENMEATIKRFVGAPSIVQGYGMSELSGGFSMCTHGRFHMPPWIIPYQFDVESGELLPRFGIQTGQAGFFDLTSQSYWGGLISGDMVEIDWNACKCGRTTPHIQQDVSRLASPFEGDHVMGPASASAIKAAVLALND